MKITNKNIKPITKGDELLDRMLKTSKVIKKKPITRVFNTPKSTVFIGDKEIEVCPECDTPLTVTKWGLHEEAVCGGCGYTETTK